MLVVKCINKIRGKTGVILSYVIMDTNGEVRQIHPIELKQAIKAHKIECVNLKLSANESLIDKKEDTNLLGERTETAKFMEWAKKNGVRLGEEINYRGATYRIGARAYEDITLVRVPVTDGTFVIQPFVTDIARGDYANKKNAFKDARNIRLINKSMNITLDKLFFHTNVEEVDMSGFNAFSADSMQGFFEGCEKIRKVNMSKANLSKVKDMSSMFRYCRSLENIDFSKAKIDSVEDIGAMFNAADIIKKIDLSSFDMSHVKHIEWLFANCYKLEEIDLSNLDTSSIKDTYRAAMLRYCSPKIITFHRRKDTDTISPGKVAGISSYSKIAYKFDR